VIERTANSLILLGNVNRRLSILGSEPAMDGWSRDHRVRIRYWASQFDRDDIEDVAPLLALSLAERSHDLTVIAPQTDYPGSATGDERLSIHRIGTSGRDATDLPTPASLRCTGHRAD
jgi:hypothetical protein